MRDVFGDLICYKKIPEYRVIVNPQAPNAGLAETWRTTNASRQFHNAVLAMDRRIIEKELEE